MTDAPLTTPRWLLDHGYRENINFGHPNWFRTAVVGREVIRLAARVGEPVEDVVKRERNRGIDG